MLTCARQWHSNGQAPGTDWPGELDVGVLLSFMRHQHFKHLASYFI